ncbi:hypothetical protein [Microtetraspora sp. NBRC 13810]|nr:hypothetical protein [Microtetraspora sp. NBRC 13810]
MPVGTVSAQVGGGSAWRTEEVGRPAGATAVEAGRSRRSPERARVRIVA